MSHIYSKEHQRLLKTPILEKPKQLDPIKIVDLQTYCLQEDYDVMYQDDLRAYNNWLNDDKINPRIPEEHKEYFERYKDGEIVPESEFEITVALQNVLDKDDIITWCVGSLMIEGQWKKIYVALPIIKEEQDRELTKECMAISESSLKEVWNNEKDDRWNDLLNEEQSKDDNVVSNKRDYLKDLGYKVVDKSIEVINGSYSFGICQWLQRQPEYTEMPITKPESVFYHTSLLQYARFIERFCSENNLLHLLNSEPL